MVPGTEWTFRGLLQKERIRDNGGEESEKKRSSARKSSGEKREGG